MAIKLHKWFLAFMAIILLSASSHHPIYVSVTEIEYNSKAKALEISCKVFTDDFEKTLRVNYNKKHIDLLDEKYRADMDVIVNDYLQKHLIIKVNDKPVSTKFVGYEQIEEGIYCYFEAPQLNPVHKLTVFNNILYDYSSQQMGIIHFINNGERTSSKLVNPSNQVIFTVK